MCKKSLVSDPKTYMALLLVFCLFICSCKESPGEDSTPTGNNSASAGDPEGTKPANPDNSSAANTASQLVPLEIKLPKPHFQGTPQNINVANLEPARQGPRPLINVPAGTTNVALGKPVSSTSMDPPIIGKLEQITDGDKEATDGSYVELDPFKQSVTIDLQAEYEIYAVVFWHYHQQARVYYDVIVQVSNDPDFITGVETLFNNDIDNSAGFGIGSDKHYVDKSEGKLVEAKGVR
ncbi:MAG: hypothetical protein ACYTBJ_12840, partial [Planctomycetota bacterium]